MSDKLEIQELIEGKGVRLTGGRWLSFLDPEINDLSAGGVRERAGRLQNRLEHLGVKLVDLQRFTLEQMGREEEVSGEYFAMNSSSAGGVVYCAGAGYVMVPDVSLKDQILSCNNGEAMQLVISAGAKTERCSVACVENYYSPSNVVKQTRWFVFRR